MKRLFRVSPRLAFAMLLACLPLPAAAQGTELGAVQGIRGLPALVEELEIWLDANAPWPRRDQPPAIRLVDARSVAALSGAPTFAQGAAPRGVYDDTTGTVYLVSPWNARNPQDVGVLLHELAHHRQATAGYWYCDGAKELPVYRLQESWLKAQGLEANVNWITVVLESGCARRDIHPD